MDKMEFPFATKETGEGERVSVNVWIKGESHMATGVYMGTTYYADNSVVGLVKLDKPVGERKYQTVHFEAPRGDLCF